MLALFIPNDTCNQIDEPNIHPNIVSYSEVVLAIVFVFVFDATNPTRIGWALALLILGNLFDAVDGSIARKHGYDLEKGWIVDVSVDRITEFITFILFPWPWMVIWFINWIGEVLKIKRDS